MLSIPSSRRYLVPTVCLFCLVSIYRLLTVLTSPSPDVFLSSILASYLQLGIEIQREDRPNNLEHVFVEQYHASAPLPTTNIHIKSLLQCPIDPNPHTNHIRLPHTVYNISLTDPSTLHDPLRRHFNPTFLPLPHHSRESTYLLVSRLVTTGFHQESHICFASICRPAPADSQTFLPPGTKACTAFELDILGPGGGLRCDTAPIKINIPPTPAKQCHGAWVTFPDIPGFHDPRIFWSGKGEPLIIVNSASRYGCVGLWVVDLRTLVPELDDLMGRKGRFAGNGMDEEGRGMSGWTPAVQRMSYPHLTEITRNPRSSRNDVEKNWIMFFPEGDEAWIMYDMMGQPVPRQTREGDTSSSSGDQRRGSRRADDVGNYSSPSKRDLFADSKSVHFDNMLIQDPLGDRNDTEDQSSVFRPHLSIQQGRTLSLLIGNGFTTPNLSSPAEPPCFHPLSSYSHDSLGNHGHWHQGSNSLRLILCRRNSRFEAETSSSTTSTCSKTLSENDMISSGMVVHFAVLHRKFSNEIDLPMRYERYFVMWEARKPFRVLGVSRYPILMDKELARPWTEAENWPVKHEEMQEKESRENDLRTSSERVHGKRNSENKDRNNPAKVEALDSRKHQVGVSEGDKSSAYFTYTPSLSWAWRLKSEGEGIADDQEEHDNTDLGTGYLDDDVLVGIGMDDVNQGFAIVKAETLLSCLRVCPGFEESV